MSEKPSFVFIQLHTLLQSEFRQPFPFQPLPHSLGKTGVTLFLPAQHACLPRANRLLVNCLESILTETGRSMSFGINTYGNTPGAGVTMNPNPIINPQRRTSAALLPAAFRLPIPDSAFCFLVSACALLLPRSAFSFLVSAFSQVTFMSHKKPSNQRPHPNPQRFGLFSLCGCILARTGLHQPVLCYPLSETSGGS